jgi:hypothetical protein
MSAECHARASSCNRSLDKKEPAPRCFWREEEVGGAHCRKALLKLFLLPQEVKANVLILV